MKILFYPKHMLEAIWCEDKKAFAPDVKEPPMCLRCGTPLNRCLIVNSLSRYADIYICKSCGADEAMRDAFGEPLPLMKWAGLSDPRKKNFLKNESSVFLTPVCTFQEICNDAEKAGAVTPSGVTCSYFFILQR